MYELAERVSEFSHELATTIMDACRKAGNSVTMNAQARTEGFTIKRVYLNEDEDAYYASIESPLGGSREECRIDELDCDELLHVAAAMRLF